jgi:catechol 2,3-dioxygenase-like lactoylglutathione lyase family enzyme
MTIRGIDHFNITAAESVIDLCRAFYRDVLGLSEGRRPTFQSVGYWLYAGDRPVVHLSVTTSPRATPPPAPLDHIAFECADLDAFLARLKEHGVAYELDRVPDSGEAQIFLRDPAGVGLELNFAN